jgi:hypothetical protein
MTMRIKLAITLVTFLAALAFTTTASAQAGVACSGTVCGLGGQIRGQIGDGLPLPISIAPGYTGPFIQGTTAGGANNVVMGNNPFPPSSVVPGLVVGQGLGQQGQIKPTASATMMQTTAIPGSQGRAITQQPGQFGYGPAPQGSIGVVNFNNAVFAVQTSLIFDSPHPGTDGNGNPVNVPGGGGSRMLSKGLKGGGTIAAGRPGLATVSYYAGATGLGSPANNYGNAKATPNQEPIVLKTAMAGDAAGVNGVARFIATRNQFGGVSTGRTLGTAKVFFNGVNGGINPAVDLPCTGGALCAFQLSTVIPGTTGVAGGPFGGSVNNPKFTTASGVFTGTIGFNGTIVNINGAGLGPLAFTGQNATSVGFPVTTGRMSITVTSMLPADPSEMWRRTGTDARTAGGNGVIALVTGSMSARNISLGNANRTWTTLEIPEPSAIFAASAGLFALFGCHQLVRRRNR